MTVNCAFITTYFWLFGPSYTAFIIQKSSLSYISPQYQPTLQKGPSLIFWCKDYLHVGNFETNLE